MSLSLLKDYCPPKGMTVSHVPTYECISIAILYSNVRISTMLWMFWCQKLSFT